MLRAFDVPSSYRKQGFFVNLFLCGTFQREQDDGDDNDGRASSVCKRSRPARANGPLKSEDEASPLTKNLDSQVKQSTPSDKKANEAKKNNKQLLCNLVVDEMAIRKHLDWDGKKFRGYVNIGKEVDDDSNAVASEALVFVLVSLDSHWKVPCGYFLINGLSGKERANIVKLCLTKLHETGVHVTSLTCDGLRCNFTMFKDLGAFVEDASAMSTSFPHPVTQEKVYCLLDACHMVKLVRNALSALGCLRDASGASVSWDYIVQLQELQEKEGLHAATKLRAAHIQWQKQKMKVNLAVQTLSTSVADAIDFCREDLQLPQFKNSEGTVKFIRMFDKLFDFLNSRNPVANGFKAPLRPSNKGTWMNFFEEVKEYIRGAD
ncbi:hypothetical protein MRX96_010534 [Rhipicephalus microplus]